MAKQSDECELVNLYIEICFAQLGTQVRGNILAVSISGAALPYSAVWVKQVSLYNVCSLLNKLCR